MLDPKKLRNELPQMAEALAKRGFELPVAEFEQLETRRREVQMRTEKLQSERNSRSKSIGKAKAAGEDIQPLLAAVADLGGQLSAAEAELKDIQSAVEELALSIPNTPAEDVPSGASEDDNVEVAKWGEPKQFDFEVKDHVELGEQLEGKGGLIDFDAGSKLTGSGFVVMRGKMARLHRALTQFMLDTHSIEHGYNETYVPYIVNQHSLRGTGQLPKF